MCVDENSLVDESFVNVIDETKSSADEGTHESGKGSNPFGFSIKLFFCCIVWLSFASFLSFIQLLMQLIDSALTKVAVR